MIPTIFFICLVVFILSWIISALNMARMMKPEGDASGFGLHMICVALSGLSGLGLTITGIIWLVTFIIAEIKA